MSDLQERMKRAVALLGEEEVKNIMRDEGKIEVGYVSVGPCAHSLLGQKFGQHCTLCDAAV